MWDVGCQMSDRMSDFHNFVVGFFQLGCWIFTTLLSDSQQLGSDGTYSGDTQENPSVFTRDI